MASNDMNSWDEEPDELLRQDWQRAFAEFKVQSRPALRQNILRRATVRNRPKPTGWLVGGILVLLLSAVLIYTIRRSSRPTLSQGRIANVQPVLPNHTERATARQLTTPARLARSSGQTETGLQDNGPVAGQPKTGRQPTVSGAKTATEEGFSKPPGLRSNRLRLRAESTLPLVNSYRAGRSSTHPTRFSDTRFSVTLPPSPDASHRERVAPVMENTDEGTGNPAGEPPGLVSQPVSPVPSVVFARLETLALSALPSSLRALPNQLPTQESATHPASADGSRVRRFNQWFVETVPLSSFQWMSTSPTSTVHLTQVNAPAAFSPATWGYQINGGVRWQHWQAYLSVGQLRRWAYYTVNENRFRMDPGPANSFQQVQERHVVAENVALPMIGGGLNHYRFLKQGRYTVELGSQVVYSPIDGQTLASLRGGASRRVLLSRRLELQAGLMAEYGLNRLMSQQQQLTIHPFVVGVSIRIQPRLYSLER